jgi:hypothetical protein
MDSSHELRIALIKIRLMADISRDAQCRADELHMVLEMISEFADRALDEDESAQSSASVAIYDDEC